MSKFKKGHKINIGKKRSIEFKKNLSKKAKKRWKNADFRKKMNGTRKGENNPNWKSGRMKDGGGYILIYQPNHPFCNNLGYIREHRFVVEKQIGRYLKPKEVTHHLGKKDDNRPKMLMAFINHSNHRKFECNVSIKQKNIIFDGRNI